ncbi:selenocysteine lyase isoform X6 [Malaclemys terrapin pileata]|uniref:selenocysteine lyase isoform X6 n=1 Tax=Malaclemys terrapin pileata TaxID=2991368 RepID=UPI0023A81D58|nr:selenocysteine lyase isoform X6 [Malaclemys terrapin pileata]
MTGVASASSPTCASSGWGRERVITASCGSFYPPLRSARPRPPSAGGADFCRMDGDQVEKMVLTKDGRKTAVDKECDGEEKKSVESKVYMDYNATTPMAPEVIQTVTEAMHEAWGNPSSSYTAEATFVPVSKITGQVEVDDIIAAIRPTTCLVSIMLANNETGVIMPISELSQQIQILNQNRMALGLPRILMHTDAAQMIGKGRVDGQDLGVDYLTIVGHKFYAPRIGALYVRGPGVTTPLHPMLFGGGQEWNFRPGTENTPMIAGLGKAAELVNKNCEAYEAHMKEVRDYLEKRLEASFGKQRLHFNSQFPGAKRLCNTCNFSFWGPGLQGRMVLSHCKTLLASVGAACHSEKGDQPSSILLSCGIPYEVAQNALRLSVGRDTTKEDVDMIVEDLKQSVAQLEQNRVT